MKLIINLFTNGLVSDMHPLTTDDKGIVDALNATLITYNGNEMILLNDMGNTLILDSATGNIMGLSPGFIPIGLKEHGGIMYIASVNKEGEGEIGTIPSPIIRDMYKSQISVTINKNIPIDSGDPIQITNKLYPADKFITNLQMSIDPSTLKGIKHTKISELAGNNNDPCDIILERQIVNSWGPNESIKVLPIYSPVISYSSDSEDLIKLTGLVNSVTVRKKGIYNLNLYSFFDQGKSTVANLNLLSAQVYGDNGDKTSLFWFLHTYYPTSVFPKDLFNATLNKDLKQVPVSNKPGKLAVKLIQETITDFGMLPRASEPYDTPITYKTTEEQFYTYFPGFYYTSDSGLYVEKLTARVIDENTNLSVDLEYPYGKEILFDRYDLNDLSYTKASNDYEDPFFNGGLKLWDISNDEFGLPHARSKDSNTYILSPIAGLFNHEKTSFKSSTQGKNESAHSGVFLAELGENYDHWYRLEVDYEDLYGGNKGTFITRFNPYLNDVFGTNLGIDDISLTDGLVIGDNSSISFYNTFKIPTINIDNAQITYEKNAPFADWKWATNDWKDAELFSTFDHVETFQRTSDDITVPFEPLLTVEPDIYRSLRYFFTDIVPFDSINWEPDDTLPSSYPINLFGQNFELQLENINGDKDSILLPEAIALGGDININEHYINHTIGFIRYLKDTNVPTMVMKKFSTPSVSNTEFDGIGWVISTSNYLPDITTSAPIENIFNYYNNQLKIEFPKKAQIKNKSEISISFPETKDFEFYPLCNGDTGLQVYYDEKFKGIQATRKNWAYANKLKKFKVSGTTAVLGESRTFQYKTEVSKDPSFKIIPYFLFLGTNNDGLKINIQRFGKTNNTDIVYEHNFEYIDGKIHNFINEDFDNETYSSAPCSYNESNPFFYVSSNISQLIFLLYGGIYVLNIQKCPGVDNWTQNGTDPVLNLEIKIGDSIIYSYPKRDDTEPIGNWSINALDTNKYLYKTSNEDSLNMSIYVPIVLIIPQSTVNIRISAVGNYTFNRLSIGLYKINNVTSNDIDQDLSDLKQVYVYHDYMKIISNMAENRDFDKIKQYNFIQKYGVFFKEAFVFVDGIYKDNKVNPITIGDKTYQPCPYIPSDPSVLPVLLSIDNNYYWNTYYMPESVLDSDECDFIFSNAEGLLIIDNIKPVNSNKLRQLTKVRI